MSTSEGYHKDIIQVSYLDEHLASTKVSTQAMLAIIEFPPSRSWEKDPLTWTHFNNTRNQQKNIKQNRKWTAGILLPLF